MMKILNYICLCSLFIPFFGAQANLPTTNISQQPVQQTEIANFIGTITEFIPNPAYNEYTWWVTVEKNISGPAPVGDSVEVRDNINLGGSCLGSYDTTLQAGEKAEVLGYWSGTDELDLCGGPESAGYYIKRVVTCETPAGPTQLGPSGTINDNTPTLTWAAGEGATEYHFELYSNSDINKPIISQVTSNPSYTLAESLPDGGYQYRVESHNTLDGCDVYSSWSRWGTFTISTAPANHAPVANNNSYDIGMGVQIHLLPPGILINDMDADSDTLTAVLVKGTTHGTLTFNADGSFYYTPNTNWSGTDSFTYQAYDGKAYSNVVTVTINVVVCNIPEVPALVSPANGSTTNDNTPTFTWNTVSAATEYQIQVDNNADFTSPAISTNTTSTSYTPTTALADSTYSWRVRGYNGITACMYYGSWSSARKIIINTTPVNHVPVAVGDNYSTTEDSPLAKSAPGVLANDTDADGNALSAVLVAGPTHGAVMLNSNGSFTYSPNAGWAGVDNFTYKVTDGKLDSNVVTVTINVSSVSCLKPGTPSPSLPTDGVIITNNKPDFKWSTTSNSNEYHIQIDNEADFSSPIVDRRPTTTSSTYLPTNAITEGSYYWHVRGHNTSSGCDIYGDWSNTRSLTITTRDWTILYYLDGDNDLDDGMTTMLNRVEEGLINPNVTAVALLASKGSQYNYYYHVKYDTNMDKLATYTGQDKIQKEKSSMGEPKTLWDFLIWGMTTYPANHYAVILSDHGGGLSGAMKDELYSEGKLSYDILSVKETQEALQRAKDNIPSLKNKKIDILFMNACLMGMIEVGYEFRNLVDYYIASEELLKPGNYAYISITLKQMKNGTDPKLATRFFISGFTQAMEESWCFRYTLSVADLSQSEAIRDAVDQLAQALIGEIAVNKDAAKKLSKIHEVAYHYHTSHKDLLYDDLGDLAKRIKEGFQNSSSIVNAADMVLNVLHSYYIIDTTLNYELEYGASIFFPNTSSSFYNSENYDFVGQTGWKDIHPSFQTSASSIGWGKLLVEVIKVVNPNGPDIAYPPDPVEPVELLFFPSIVR